MEAFFLCAEDDVVADFREIAAQSSDVAAYFAAKKIDPTPAVQLLETTDAELS